MNKLNDTPPLDECMICGESLKTGFTERLTCNHVYHYECILKTFQMVKPPGSSKNRCPYCRANVGYLTLVNGLTHPLPKIHYNPLLTTCPEYVPQRCSHILTRGVHKGQPCDKKCQLGLFVCKIHKEAQEKAQIKAKEKEAKAQIKAQETVPI